MATTAELNMSSTVQKKGELSRRETALSLSVAQLEKTMLMISSSL